MASIILRRGKYSVRLNKNNNHLSRTFKEEEDAKLFVYYKEKLIQNMDNFQAPINTRIMMNQLFELKLDDFADRNPRSSNDFKNAKDKFEKLLPDKFYHEISYDEWVKCAKDLLDMDVYRGAKKEKNKRKMSVESCRKTFAYASSAVSFAQYKGINIENMPLKVLQTFLTPMKHEIKKT